MGHLGAARAQSPVVIELYTSQGCGECLPADALLAEIGARDDVIALALHVDYWDYLGWRDVFARPANARRQRAYGEALDTRFLITPQAIVNGAASAVGSRREALETAIAQATATPAVARIEMSESAGWVAIEVEGVDSPQAATVTLFVIEPPSAVFVSRGENRERILKHRNVVRNWWTLGPWDGSHSLWSAPAPQDAEAIVIVVQEHGPGRVLGAARHALAPVHAVAQDATTIRRLP